LQYRVIYQGSTAVKISVMGWPTSQEEHPTFPSDCSIAERRTILFNDASVSGATPMCITIVYLHTLIQRIFQSNSSSCNVNASYPGTNYIVHFCTKFLTSEGGVSENSCCFQKLFASVYIIHHSQSRVKSVPLFKAE